jgi:hypothetical protein
MQTATGLKARKMSKRMQEQIRKQFCRRQASYLWGKKRILTPELLPFVFGDGKQVLAVRPIRTRREHFVVLIDSSVKVYSGGVHDIIDDIYELHMNTFGCCSCQDCGGEPIDDDDDCDKENAMLFSQWPIICRNTGCEWWLL